MRTLKPSSKNNLLRSYNSSDTIEFNESPTFLKKESSFKPSNSHSPEKQLNPFLDHRYLQPFKDMVPLRQQEFEKLPEINTKSSRNIVFSPHLKNMLHSQQNISMVQGGSPKKKTIMQLLGQSSSSNEIFLLDTQPSELILQKEKSSESALANTVTGQQQHQSRFFKMNSIENNFNRQQGNVQEQEKEKEEEQEEEEEYHVWDNSFYQGIGFDIDHNFQSSNLLNFVQLFYVRSQLYQEANVSKADILDEVKVLSAMSNVDVNDFQCSKQIDQMEHQYNISLKKNAQQVAKLSLIPRRRYICAPTTQTPADPEGQRPTASIPNTTQQFKHSKFLPLNSSQVNLSPPSRILKNRPYPEQLILPDGQKSNLLYSESYGRFGMTQFNNNNNNLQHLSNQQNQLFRICSQNNLGQPNQQELHNRQEESSSPLLRDKKKSQMKAQLKLNASKGFFQKRRVQMDVNNISIKSLSSLHQIKNHTTTHQDQSQNIFERTKNGMEISLFKKSDKQVGQICQIPSSEFIQTKVYA